MCGGGVAGRAGGSKRYIFYASPRRFSEILRVRGGAELACTTTSLPRPNSAEDGTSPQSTSCARTARPVPTQKRFYARAVRREHPRHLRSSAAAATSLYRRKPRLSCRQSQQSAE